MDTHLRHEQRQQENLVLRHVVVLQEKTERRMSTHLLITWMQIFGTYQQDADGHERSSSRGDSAVHQDHIVLADVFGQTEVVKLRETHKITGCRGDLQPRAQDYLLGVRIRQ